MGNRMIFGVSVQSLLLTLLLGCGAEPQSSPTADIGEQPREQAASDESDQPVLSPAEDDAKAQASGKEELDVGELTFSVPEGWVSQQPKVSFVLAEFTLPRAEGDDADGRLTVSMAGGSIEANIDRWRDQFGGKPEQQSEQKVSVEELEITRVDFSGEYNDQRGPFAPAQMHPGYRMLAAIIPINNTLCFVKATGPEKTIASHQSAFDAFVHSVRKD